MALRPNISVDYAVRDTGSRSGYGGRHRRQQCDQRPQQKRPARGAGALFQRNQPRRDRRSQWTTTNAAIATVSGTGLVTSVGYGMADIGVNGMPNCTLLLFAVSDEARHSRQFQLPAVPQRRVSVLPAARAGVDRRRPTSVRVARRDAAQALLLSQLVPFIAMKRDGPRVSSWSTR